MIYKFSYYIFHPWKIIEEFYYKIKYFLQRGFRGWDDTILWSIDYYLAEMMPIWLKKFKKNLHWHPAELTEEKWDEILDKIIAGFEAGYRIASDDSKAWDEIWEEWEKRYPDEEMFQHIPYKELPGGREYFKMKSNPKWDDLQKELNYDKKKQKEYDKNLKIFNEGIDLFKEYFFNLWD